MHTMNVISLKVFGRAFFKKLVGVWGETPTLPLLQGFKGAKPLCRGFRGETPNLLPLGVWGQSPQIIFSLTLLSLFCLSSVLYAAVPQRIVSTALTADEMLVALLGNAPRLRAVSALARNKLHSNIYHLRNLPPTLQATSVEHVVSLRPDLIVYSVFNRPEFVNLAQHLGISTLVLKKATRLEHILANIDVLGKKIGAVTSAQRLVSSLRQQLARVVRQRSAVKKPLLLNFFADNTVMGGGTLFDGVGRCGGWY